MKNTLFLCFIALYIVLSSCECKEVEPDTTTRTQGKMSVRILEKNNDAIVPFSPYKEADFRIYWIYSGNGRQILSIAGDYLDNTVLNPISRGFDVSFVREIDKPTSSYKASIDGNQVAYQSTEFFKCDGFGYDSRSTSLDAINLNENLTLTKDDADSLVGNFRVRLKTIALNSVDTITVEGRFSCAKNGLFTNPLKK